MPATPPFNDAAQAALYKSYHNNNSYKYVTGLVIVPLAADTPASGEDAILPFVVRLHQPYTIRKQTFDATKEQTPPVMPAPDTGEFADTLISSTMVIPMPQLNQTSTPSFTYTVGGEHIYLGRIPYSTSTGFPAGLWPFKSELLQTLQGPAINALGGLVGGAATTFNVLGTIGPSNNAFNSGEYQWPLTSIIPAGFFDPSLSSSFYPIPFGTV